ncbi:hypothetical protein [Streptomyces sp. NPDC000994]
MKITLVAHSRLALRKAWASGLLDERTYTEAAAMMDELGVRDGAMIAYEGGNQLADLQQWLDQMPLKFSASTRHRYAKHAGRLYEHIVGLGLTLGDVDGNLLRGWAQQRQQGRNPKTWDPEQVALMSLFRWLASPANPARLFESSPWPMWISGSRETSAVDSGPYTLSADVRMLDATEWMWLRNVGLAGRCAGPDTLPPRYPERDTALGDLMVTTGMRVGEARCLLIDEVPQPSLVQRSRPWPNTILFAGGERAKTRGGKVPFLPEVGDRLWAWWESSVRQAIVEAAQPTLRKRLRAGLLFVVEEVRSDKGMCTFSGQWLGRAATWSADTLPSDAAEAAVRVVGSRIEPLTLWQTDANGGGPMSTTALRDVFDEATVRVAGTVGHPFGPDLLRYRAEPGRARPRQVVGGVTPHMARHTAAVNWLVDLTLENERRARGEVSTRHHNLPSSGPLRPMHYVRTWLRHLSESTSQLYQTWVHRQDWPQARTLGSGVRDLVADREVTA